MDASLLFYGLLLLLAAWVREDQAGGGGQAGGGDQAGGDHGDHASRLRGLWRLSMRDSKVKGKDLSHPIRGLAQQQLLYCRVGIGYHLQILSNGSVGGVHEPTEHSVLKVFAMQQRGVVGVLGIRSSLYLCVSEEGVTSGAKEFTDDCLWKETMEENHYTTYSSLSHPGVYLALSHRGEVKRGTSVARHQPYTHFLPRRAL